MSFKYVDDPKLKTNALESIREALATIEGAIWYLTPNEGALIGPPTSGPWTLDELWVDSERSIWRCSSGGSPGSWLQVLPAVATAFPSGTIPEGYVVIRSDLRYTQFRYVGGTWVTRGRFVHTQSSPLAVWNVTHNLGYRPGTWTLWIGDEICGAKVEHLNDNELTVTMNSAQSGQLILE